MQTDLDPAIYEKAALIIEERGWHQGDYCEEKTEGLGPVCVLGAINAALHGDARIVNDSYTEPVHNVAMIREPAGAAGYWNDMPGRTVDEVTSLLRETADKVRQGEL